MEQNKKSITLSIRESEFLKQEKAGATVIKVALGLIDQKGINRGDLITLFGKCPSSGRILQAPVRVAALLRRRSPNNTKHSPLPPVGHARRKKIEMEVVLNFIDRKHYEQPRPHGPGGGGQPLQRP